MGGNSMSVQRLELQAFSLIGAGFNPSTKILQVAQYSQKTKTTYREVYNFCNLK